MKQWITDWFVKTRNKLEETRKTDTGEVNLIPLPSQHHYSGLRITSRRSIEGRSINHPKRINPLNLVFIIDNAIDLATSVIVPWGREIRSAEWFHCLVIACIYKGQTTIKRLYEKEFGNCFLNPFYGSQSSLKSRDLRRSSPLDRGPATNSKMVTTFK